MSKKLLFGRFEFDVQEEVRMNLETDWIHNITETAIEYFRNRTIVLWGKYKISDRIRERLAEHNITDVIYVDKDESKWDEKEVFSTQIIDGNADIYYIVISVGVYDSIRKKLTEGGYNSIVDYYYFSDCIVKESDEYYEDAHGNKIFGNRLGLKFVFSGWNSEIKIGSDVNLDSLQLYMHNDMHIKIGDRVKGKIENLRMKNHSAIEIGDDVIIDGTQVEIGEYSSLKIGSRSLLGRGGGIPTRIVLRQNADVLIGDDFSVAGDFFFMIGSNTMLEIGKDNMFSWGTRIFTMDGHAIFDVASGEVINSGRDEEQKREIIIGDHVWVGLRATIFYGTSIGNGSIVGACSFVKGVFPNNCMIAGVPAKMIKKDVCWSRNSIATDIQECGEAYIDYTQMP